MKEKQPRGPHGHFASKDAADKGTAKPTKKKVINWHEAYDEKVLEVKMLNEIIADKDGIIDQHIGSMKRLYREIENRNESVNYQINRADKYFETVERQNNLINECIKQLEWLESKLPWYRKVSLFRTLKNNNKLLCHMRANVLDSMRDWSSEE